MWIIEYTTSDVDAKPDYLSFAKTDCVIRTDNQKNNYDIEIDSDCIKISLSPSTNFYHFFYDFLGNCLEVVKGSFLKNFEFVFFVNKHPLTEKDKNTFSKMEEFIHDIFNKLGIKYHIVHYESRVKCNHFAEIANQNPPFRPAYDLIYDTLMDLYPTELKEPWKKVYVSRLGSASDKDESTKRISDEKKLQDYFVSMGYEIHFRPNLDNQNLLEDILYFRDVKTIAGISGAGLTNALFMPRGGNVIEIAVPQITGTNNENSGFPETHIRARHLFHPVLAFEKGHIFYQVPIYNKNAEEAIIKLKKIGVDKLT